MNKSRLEAFSDGVFAIIITIMVLELKIPHGAEFKALLPVLPVFFSYILSFIFLGIYWSNHHHMLHTVKHVTGGILWANLHLLFWLSLFPFVTGWMGENYLTSATLALYGTVLFFAAGAYYILQNVIIKSQGKDSVLAKAIGTDIKGKASPILYVAGIASAYVSPLLAESLYILVALIWLIPDKRIERMLLTERTG
ncbi:MAG TPA: TMEM175 family protein [Ignavibacteriaceae bacterium]|nr:TMEM175 family protein [Ignavibacteriaceae bacterium]